MKRTVAIAAGAFLLIQGAALAHAVEKHRSKHKADAQMQKLHDMMPMYGAALANVENALGKKDAAAVEAEAGRMLATTPDLKKSKPHKNLKQLKKFRSIAARFESDLKETVELAKKGDFAKAGEAFKKAEAKCVECHGKFR